jgi:hypothetical protein
MPQEFHLRATEQAFVRVDHEAVALKHGEDRLQVSPMRARIRAGDEDVV